MKRTLITGICGIVVGAGLVAGTGVLARGDAAQNAAVQQCGTASAPQLRTTMYFGLARPKGSVSELEWQMFLRDEVTARFPQGLTVWEAEGSGRELTARSVTSERKSCCSCTPTPPRRASRCKR